MRVCDLEPGDVFATGTVGDACFIARTDHPIYDRLQLVVWRLEGGGWSHDALSPEQDLYSGELIERGGVETCKAALFGQGRWSSNTEEG